MAALTTQSVVAAGTKPTWGAAAASDTAEVGDGTDSFVVYKNTDSNAKTITIDLNHLTLETGDVHPDKTFALGATTGELWIPLRKYYADAAQNGIGRCALAVSGTGGVTGVTVAVIRMG